VARPEAAEADGRTKTSGLSRLAGLSHVAAVSFLASRAVPAGGFVVGLPGGVALARAGERHGAREGYGASLAAMIQSVAVIGPARFGTPLTQALSAPLLGRMDARGRGLLAQVLACAAIRIAQNGLGAAFFLGVITGPEAAVATYNQVVADLISLPRGTVPALVATLTALLAWAAVASTVQVLVYRRGLARWRRDRTPEPKAPHLVPDELAATEPLVPRARPRRRFDPRAVALATLVAFCVLLAGLSWPLLAAVTAWLVLASIAIGGIDRRVLSGGLALTAVLAVGAFSFTAIGGLGIDLALRRGARAALLVLVATWLRAAAGSDGLREVGRRVLGRLDRLPSVREAVLVLDDLGATPRLAAAGRGLLRSVRAGRKRPLAVIDAVLAWVRQEVARFNPAPHDGLAHVRVRARDAVLVGLALAPAAALPFG
jgi:hypothetical protein